MKRHNSIKAIVNLVFIASLMACSNARQATWRYQPPEDFSIVQAVGYAPISLQSGASDNEKQLRAMKASKLDAYRELSEQVYGRQLQSESTVSELVLGNEQLASSVAGVIRGAKVVRSYTLDDTYVTELELDFREVYRVTMSMAPTRHLESEEIIHF